MRRAFAAVQGLAAGQGLATGEAVLSVSRSTIAA